MTILQNKNLEKTTRFIFEHLTHAWKIHSRDFIAIAGEMRRFPASNENTDSILLLLLLHNDFI